MHNFFQVLWIYVLFGHYRRVNALDCYVCTEKEGNIGPCIRTVQRCEPSQDACQSLVVYRTTPRWTVLAKRRAFVTKGCTTRAACFTAQNQLSPLCTPSETRNWMCSYCCITDNCNYQVPNHSTSTRFNLNLVCPSIWLVWKGRSWIG
ncbi:hypothetical protein D915_003496 [Fasciola hepatica]|uniref:UPAR/Ly6 domain-containing protein n=1 Tax=Fasciola hepatica TaxID=6192 RepID=A0A4E0RUS3_FASHE|nr:hypothetical protein D915_003496 [Fasciola hepatica]